MTEVRRGHDVIVTKITDDLRNAWIIGISGNEALPLEVVPRMHLQPGNVESTEPALDAGGKPIQPEWHPAGAGFQMHHFELGVTFEHAAHNESSTGQHIAHRESNGRLRGTEPR